MATFTTDTTGPITLDLTAPVADITIRTRPDLATATLQANGPDDVVSTITEHRDADRWTVRLPDPAPTVTTSSTGRTTQMVVGNISGGSVVVGGGNVTISGGISGGTVINGSTLTSAE